jgi:hypothetical protein
MVLKHTVSSASMQQGMLMTVKVSQPVYYEHQPPPLMLAVRTSAQKAAHMVWPVHPFPGALCLKVVQISTLLVA